MKNIKTISLKGIRTTAKLVAVLSTCILALFSCDDFVDVDTPTSQLSSPIVFENYTTASAAIVAVYAQIRGNGLLTGNPNGMSAKLGEYTDELVFYGAGGQTDASFYNNTVLPRNSDVQNWWNSSFNQIYATNAVLEGLANSTTLTEAQRNRLSGEAIFVRAMLHFHLTNIFGAIPFVETTDYRVNSTIPKIPVADIYARVEADLLLAESLLDEDYITSDRVRPNKATVQALLARVFLYEGKWAEAENKASAVLNNTTLYPWESNIDAVFLKQSTNTIWHLMPATDGENAYEAGTHIFLQGPPPVSALSTEFVNSFEPGDNRRTHWIKEVTDGTNTWYHAYKYKEFGNTGSSVEYSIVFRTAEQYLIRAEARAQQGELIGAKEDLNKIRETAGLGDTMALTTAEILEVIARERRAELFTEGHRFFDLKRTNMLDNALSVIKTGWNDTDDLLPLPETELLLNPNLNPQNPGY